MKYYNSYMERQHISSDCHQRLLEIGERKPVSARWHWGRWAALAACCVLVLGLGVWRLTTLTEQPEETQSDAIYPGIPDHFGPGEEDEEGVDEGLLALPMLPYIYYQSVEGKMEMDSTLPRELMEGSFVREVTEEDIQRIFWGGEENPETDGSETQTGALPWMLYWGDYTLTTQAIYDSSGNLMWVAIGGENGEADSSFTLTLRPGALPFNCCLYSDLETTEVFGVPVTGWYREEDNDGDGKTEFICVSEFMAGEVGVRFENQNGPFKGEDQQAGGAQIFNALLVSQLLTQDGGVYLEHLQTVQDVPEWRQTEFASLEEAKKQAAFTPYLPQNAPEGYGDFYGRLTYQEGNKNILYLRWSRGYQDVTVYVELPEGETNWGNIVDVNKPEQYDLRLYSIPWAESVPEEHWVTVNNPVFRVQDMTRAVVEARAHLRQERGETDSLDIQFSVLHPDNTRVTYACEGLSIAQVWKMVEDTRQQA